MNKLFIVGIVLCGVATIASIISTVIPYWIYDSSTIGDLKESIAMGLWKICTRYSVHSSSQTSCVDAIGTDWWKAVQALMIIGILLMALSTVLACLFTKYNSNKHLCLGTILAAALGGIVIIIAVIVFGAKETELRSNFSAGFYLAIVSGVLALAAASLVAISSRSTGGYSLI